MPQSVLNARALKRTVVVDPAEVAQIVAPDGRPHVVIDIRLPDRRVSADLNAKSVRKVVAAISDAAVHRYWRGGRKPAVEPSGGTEMTETTLMCLNCGRELPSRDDVHQIDTPRGRHGPFCAACAEYRRRALNALERAVERRARAA